MNLLAKLLEQFDLILMTEDVSVGPHIEACGERTWSVWNVNECQTFSDPWIGAARFVRLVGPEGMRTALRAKLQCW